MIEIRNRRIVVDGKPRIVLSGEVHYFRLKRSEWEDRIRKTKDAGCQAIASYIPWIVHEEREGQIDVQGKQRPENAVGDFIDLCAKHGLWFIARPGPFVMAEMKNEGIPYWVYKDKESLSVGWEGKPATTHTLDYLEPGFLAAAKRWYGGIMPVLSSRLQPKGGPVIAVQLDNEIGMLSWVSNQPELNDHTLCDLASWIVMRYSPEELHRRYPFDLNDPMARTRALREPKPEYQAALHRDLGDFERARFARYIATLRGYAESQGVNGVPFIVNIHGTGGGKAATFPIGIHQLYEAYTQAPGYLSGSDHYLGELTRDNAPDLYFLNTFMVAVHRPEQPLTSTEFEVGSGDYGETGAVRQSGASADLKIRMCVAQGNRLLNYYLIAGGRNPHLLDPVHDGNDRVAFTGERHGFAAPIDPEGELTYTYRALRETNRAINAVADKLADMDPEYDGVALAFLPDYYKTDFHRPGPMREIVEALEYPRGNVDLLTRALLFRGLRFTSVDIQHRPLDPRHTPALAFASAELLDESVQRKLAEYVGSGGKLFLFGAFPSRDLELRPCTVLADALGWKVAARLEANDRYNLSLVGAGWAAFEPEVRVWRAQTFADPGHGVFLRTADQGLPVGLEAALGAGKAIVLPANLPLHTRLFRTIFDRLGIQPGIESDQPDGVVLHSMRNANGERFLTLLNLDQEEKSIRLREHGQTLLGGEIVLPPRGSRLIPLGVTLAGARLAYSTAEVVGVEPSRLTFRQTPGPERLEIEGEARVTAPGATLRTERGRTLVTILPGRGTVVVSV